MISCVNGIQLTLADGTLDVTDDGAVVVIQELHSNLSHTSTRSGPTEDLDHTGQGPLSFLLLDDFRLSTGLWRGVVSEEE